ncbi:MAG: hypothetical protein DYG89_52495 [Caldilinea sp. CFX5]|nr:hypothetical protein [Caldilinea sp. CFX5]
MGLAACGGERATPTPIPADAVRPEQPTPVYAASTAFTLATPVIALPTVTLMPADPPTATNAATPIALPQASDLAALQPPPTGLGILRGGASLLTTPNGAAVTQLPAGAVVTLTGKSADGVWVAAYTENGTSGWLAANRLTLLAAETLTVVTEAVGPGLAATLVAEAMVPMAMPTITLTLTMAP